MNSIPEADGREIAAGAADVFGRAAVIERSDHFESTDGTIETGDAREQWDEWRDTFDSPAAFEARIDQCPYDRETLKRAFAMESWPEDIPLPEWIDGLDRILETVGHSEPPTECDDRLATADPERPFEPLVVFLVRIARTRIADVGGYSMLDETARLDAEQWLAHRISNVVAQPLHVRFQTRIAMDDPSVFSEPEHASPDESTTRYYDEFVETLYDGGLLDVFTVYPVAARQLVKVQEQWCAFVRDFCRALQSDRRHLEREYDVESGATVDALDLGLGDSHGGGRTVIGVSMSDGTRVAYKPRDLGAETAFFDFLGRVNDATADDRFPDPAIVSRDDHGWMEWFTPRSCDSRSDVEQYYRRAGDLLAVLYLLGASDCHFENIIADGTWPVLVDAESVIHPDIDVGQMPTDQPRKNKVTAEASRDTVLKPGLLPWYAETAGSDDEVTGLEAGDVSGLSAADPGEIVLSQLSWHQVNTDHMTAEFVRPDVAPSAHLPHLDGEPQEAEDYVSAVVSGFERTYDQLELLLADSSLTESPLSGFTDRRVRVFFRSTRLYQAIVNRLATPALQRSGIEQTLAREPLAANLVGDSGASRLFGLYEAEREALSRLDVPRFETAVDANSIQWEGTTYAADVFEHTAAAQLRDRCDALGDADRHQQAEYIGLSLGNPRVDENHHDGEVVGTIPFEGGTDGERLAVEPVQSSILDTLRSRSLSVDGDPTWVRKEFHGDDNRLSIRQLSPWLYNGRAGIALALAISGARGGLSDAHELATDVIAPLVDGPLDRWSDSFVGGGVGIGSLIYALTTAGELLDAPKVTRRADGLVSWLTADDIARDSHYDVVQGSAGLALSLINYAARSPAQEDRARRLAARCGEHLLEQRVEYDDRTVWDTMPSMTSQPTIGFSHGQSGIAYSLAKLGERLDRPAFKTAAESAFAYEDEFFDFDRANWPDVRTVGGRDQRYLDSWCYGRAGMVLARVRARRHLGGARSRPTSAALSRYEWPALATSDHLCCGNFGNVDVLVDVADVTGDDTYRQLARAYAMEVLERRDGSSFTYRAWAGDLYDPSLFLGSAGILYVLQRVASDDDTLPSVLAWE